jgi:hypothetical protein
METEGRKHGVCESQCRWPRGARGPPQPCPSFMPMSFWLRAASQQQHHPHSRKAFFKSVSHGRGGQPLAPIVMLGTDSHKELIHFQTASKEGSWILLRNIGLLYAFKVFVLWWLILGHWLSVFSNGHNDPFSPSRQVCGQTLPYRKKKKSPRSSHKMPPIPGYPRKLCCQGTLNKACLLPRFFAASLPSRGRHPLSYKSVCEFCCKVWLWYSLALNYQDTFPLRAVTLTVSIQLHFSFYLF